ncbi:MAG: glyoxalase [Oscillospiraceae bacterium]|nr:glyoxalase [Oscillospiraceae bacterium]
MLADEQESMIDKYLERGDLFALYDGTLKSVCVVIREFDWLLNIPKEKILKESHNMELYFEEDKFDDFIAKLEQRNDIKYVGRRH